MARPSKPHLWRGRQWRTRIDGKLYYLGKDERQAWAKFHRLMANQLDTEPDGRPQDIDGLAAAWLRAHPKPFYERWLRPFVASAGDGGLSAVDLDLLEQYRLCLDKRPYQRNGGPARKLAPKTIRHFVRTAAAVLRRAHRLGYVARMPLMPKLPQPTRKARDIEPERLDAILGALPKRAGAILRFIAATGCRPGEACGLEWQHVRLDAGVCVLIDHKIAESTGRPRTIYLTPEAADILRAQFKTTGPAGPVVRSRRGGAYTPAGLRSILRRRGAVPHQLRHSYAQQASATVPVEVLAQLMGHADARTTGFCFQARDARALAVAQALRIPHASRTAEKAG